MNPQRHGNIDRVGTGPGLEQIASRPDELANLVRQRGRNIEIDAAELLMQDGPRSRGQSIAGPDF